MYRPRHLRSTARRRGIILLVVLALLALFAIVGVSFVLYASTEAEAARMARDADNLIKVDIDPELAFSLVLSEILYPVPDNELGLYSSLRGWEMSRSIYGYNDMYGYTLPSFVGNPTPNPDTVAFSGTGRIREGDVLVGSTPKSYLPPGTTWYATSPQGNVISFYDPVSHRALDVNGLPVTDAAKQVQFYVDPYELINYTCYRNADGSLQHFVGPNYWQTFMHDPERPGTRAFDQMTYNPTQPPVNDLLDQSQADPDSSVPPTNPNRKGPRGLWTGGMHAPYTYPDVNSMFVAKVLTTDGRVILPSYWRPNGAFPTLDPNNPAWTDTTKPWLSYMTLRPRPADHLGFPPPEEGPTLDPSNSSLWLSPGGDVKNKLGSPGGNDSIWMNIGAPVQTAPNGQKFQMLAAILIEPVDNRLNVNVHGNIKGTNPYTQARDHTSNQGIGPWEVNLGRVLVNGAEWQNLFGGIGPGGNTAPLTSGRLSLTGRYGPNGDPDLSSSVASAGRLSHFYMQTDIDGANELSTPGYLPTSNFIIPGLSGNPTINATFPFFPQGFTNGSSDERKKFPGLYNPYGPYPLGNDDRNFAASNLEALLRYAETNSPALSSELMRLLPNNLVGNPNTPSTQQLAAILRRRLTTTSNELVRPGISPYWYSNTAAGTVSSYGYLSTLPTGPTLPPLGNQSAAGASQGLAFPPLSLRNLPAGTGIDSAPSEFGADWRSLSAALGKVDLNRYLTPYPLAAQDPLAPSTTTTSQDATSYKKRFDDPKNIYLLQGFADPATQFKQAQADRQKLAYDIYQRFLAAAGLPSGVPTASLNATTNGPKDVDLVPRRWLAQLAVNIVDFIDEDDVSTPFNFYSTSEGLLAYDPLKPLQDHIGTLVDGPGGEIPKFWVFGTEMPKVVVNEVLAQTPSYLTQPVLNKTAPTILPGSSVYVYVELYNPLTGTSAITGVNPLQGQDAQNVQLRSDQLAAGDQSLKTQGTEMNYFALGNNAPYAKAQGYENYRLRLASGTYQHGDGVTITDFNDNSVGKMVGPRTTGTTIEETFDLSPGSNESLANMDGTLATNGTSIPPGNVLLLGPSPSPAKAIAKDPFVSNTAKPPGLVAPGTPILRTPKLAYSYTLPTGVPDEASTGLTVALRRLANPHIPFDPNPLLIDTNPDPTKRLPPIVNPWYNPYVTVDYLDKVPIQEGKSSSVNNCVSRGRTQPFAGFFKYNSTAVGTPNTSFQPDPTSPVRDQLTQDMSGNTGFYHTFGNTNNPPPTGTSNAIPTVLPGTVATTLPIQAGPHYDWLVHPDRQLLSPMELLFVSYYQPHQLTQRFMLSDNPTDINQRFQHFAPWFAGGTIPNNVWWHPTTTATTTNVQDARLYRALELLDTHSYMAGSVFGGRTPGKININMLYDYQTLQALADAQPANYFYLLTTGSPIPPATSLMPPMDPNTPVTFAANYWTSISRSGTAVLYIYDPSKGVPWPVNVGDTLILDIGNQQIQDAVTVVATDPSKGYITVIGNGTPPTALHTHGATFTIYKDVLPPYFSSLILSRDGATDPATAPNTVTPRPFLSMGTGYAPTNAASTTDFMHLTRDTSIEDTLLRSDPITTSARLFELQYAPHPYPRFELMNKMYNNLTNRSNVFAVYITVGFFEVKDDTSRPVKLGPEIGKAENKNIRHRMFAIVDRTQMRAFTTAADPNFTPVIAIPSGQSSVVATITPVTPPGNQIGDNLHGINPNTTRSWVIQPGSILVVDTGMSEETVTVTSVTQPNLGTNPVTPGTFTAVFRNNHAASIPVYARGNPGPWLQNNIIQGPPVTTVPTWNYYDPRKDQDVVPHFSLID